MRIENVNKKNWILEWQDKWRHYKRFRKSLSWDVNWGLFTIRDYLTLRQRAQFTYQYIYAFEFYGYIGGPLKSKSRRFRGPHLHPKNHNSCVSLVHICTMKKRKNCLYVYLLNSILLMLIFTYHNFRTSIDRASDCKSNNRKMK